MSGISSWTSVASSPQANRNPPSPDTLITGPAPASAAPSAAGKAKPSVPQPTGYASLRGAGTGPAVSFSGDGGFLFACGELATIAQEGIPLTAVIVDDSGYGMLRYDQRLAGDPPFGVDLASPDFAAVAGAFGVDAETVEGLGAEFERALRRQLALERPTVLAARAALDPPPTTSPRWYRREPR